MELDLVTLLIVCPLVFLGGLVDSIAGGGGLITLPAYLMAGIPPHLAIGTNKLSSAMGMAVSTVRLYRAGYIDLKLSAAPVAAAFVGSVIGAKIALLVPADVFQLILVFCLPVAAFFILRKKALEPDPVEMSFSRRAWILAACAFACGAYDGFYGPGAGTFMLVAFSMIGHLQVCDAAGQMKMANFTSGIAALITFAAAGETDWLLGGIAGLFGIAGHYIGAGLVLKNGAKIVRPIIIAVMAVLLAKTVWELWLQ